MGETEDQQEICCPTIRLTIVLTERGVGKGNEDQEEICWPTIGVNGEGVGKIED